MAEEPVHPSSDFDHTQQPQTPQRDDKPLLSSPGLLASPQTPQHHDRPLLSPQYVVQIPKDQIFRSPPPENAQKLLQFANRKSRRSICCRCFCFTIAALLVFLLLLGVATTVLYFVFRPENLHYSIHKKPREEPVKTNRSQNPNNKISVFYTKGSEVNVYYDDVKLCNGVLPVFEQRPNNVTVIQTVLRGSGVVLAPDVHARLVKQDKGKNVPLKVKVKAPVKFKIGAVKTWEITAMVKCDVAVDRVTAKSKIVSRSCGYRVKLW